MPLAWPDSSSCCTGRHPGRCRPDTSTSTTTACRWRSMLLGALDVDAPGPLEPERRELATELVALLALNPEGVHPNVISSALWPRGVAEPVRDATLAHAQGWLGRDSAGRPRLRQDGTGRWVLDEDVRCDWQVFSTLAARADEAADPNDAERLRERALSLVIGPAFEGLALGALLLAGPARIRAGHPVDRRHDGTPAGRAAARPGRPGWCPAGRSRRAETAAGGRAALARPPRRRSRAGGDRAELGGLRRGALRHARPAAGGHRARRDRTRWSTTCCPGSGEAGVA